MYFNREDYGSRIRSLRKKRGLTQEQLAEKMNVSTPYIAKIETGKQTGPVELAVEFAAFFDVSLDYLLVGKGDFAEEQKRGLRMVWSLDVIELNKQISDLTSQNQMLATLKQQGLIDPDIFISQNNELTEQLRAVKLKKERLLAVDGDNTIAQTRELMEILNDGPDFLDSFDAELFGELVETIIVESNERIRFRLKNGLELTETIERTVR